MAVLLGTGSRVSAEDRGMFFVLLATGEAGEELGSTRVLGTGLALLLAVFVLEAVTETEPVPATVSSLTQSARGTVEVTTGLGWVVVIDTTVVVAVGALAMS